MSSGAFRRVVMRLITTRRFHSSARQAKNGFVAPENCFFAVAATKQFQGKINGSNILQKWFIEPAHRSMGPARSVQRCARELANEQSGLFLSFSAGEAAFAARTQGAGATDKRGERGLCNFWGRLRVVLPPREGMRNMASGGIVVGDEPLTRKPARRTAESMAERTGATTAEPAPSEPAPASADPRKRDLLKPVGAMSQQCSDSGTYSVPQEFVHLVGCCDPKAQPSRSGRPPPAPAKGSESRASDGTSKASKTQ